MAFLGGDVPAIIRTASDPVDHFVAGRIPAAMKTVRTRGQPPRLRFYRTGVAVAMPDRSIDRSARGDHFGLIGRQQRLELAETGLDHP